MEWAPSLIPSANGSLPPLGVPAQRPALDTEKKRPAIRCSLAPFARLEAMQLPPMPQKGRKANQAFVIREGASTHITPGQYPGIHAVRFPDLRQLLARLLESQLIA